MTLKALRMLGTLTAVVCATPLTAHHSSAGYFNLNKTVIVDGVIAKQLWANPHSALHLEVNSANEGTVTWILYGLPPNVLARLGYTKDTFREGQSVSAIGWPARDQESAKSLGGGLVSGDSKTPFQLMEVGEVRFADGTIASFGRGPAFSGISFTERTKL